MVICAPESECKPSEFEERVDRHAGFRQFRVLLRKTLLRKARRPFATCFELTLPLVLMLLLAYTRTRYKLQDFPEVYFNTSTVFPMSRRLFGSSNGQSTMYNDMQRQFVCSNQETMDSTLEAFFGMQLTWDGERRLVLDWMDGLNVNEVESLAADIESSMKGLSNAFKGVSNELSRIRDEYFSSDLPQFARETAATVDDTMAVLRSFRRVTSGTNEEVRKTAAIWVDEICAFWPPANGNATNRTVSTMYAINRTASGTPLNLSFVGELADMLLKKSWRSCPILSAAVKPGTEMDWHSCPVLRNADSLRTYLLAQTWNASSGSATIDDFVVWLSHFLDSHSFVASALQAQMRNWWVQTPKAPEEFRTAIGRAAWRALWSWQQVGLKLPELPAILNAAESEWNSSRLSLMRADDLTFDVIFQDACPRILKASAIGDTVMRMQDHCPFYQAAIEVNYSNRVGSAHAWLHGLDAEKLSTFSPLDNLEEYVKEMDFSVVKNTLVRVTQLVQQSRKSAAAKGTSFSPSGAANHIGTQLRTDWLVERGLKPCLTGADNQGANSSQITNGSGNGNPSTTRRPANVYTSNFMMDQLMSRKILFAPYRGESKKMLELIIVELVYSLTIQDGDTFPAYLVQALQCPLVRSLAATNLDSFLKERLLTFDTPADLERFAAENKDQVLFGLVFTSADPITGDFAVDNMNIDYAIRMHAELLPSTKDVLRNFRSAIFGGVPITTQPYINAMFVEMQEVIGRSAVRLRALRGPPTSPLGRRTQDVYESLVSEVSRNLLASSRVIDGRRMSIGVTQFPAAAWQRDGFVSVIMNMMPMIMIFSWIYAVSLLIKEIVYEKQERLRDVMRIMGLSTWVYWATWMVAALMQMALLSLLLTIVLCGARVLKHSDPTVIFFFFMVFSLSTAAFAMLVSSFFTQAKVAAACGGLLYYITYLPSIAYERFEPTLGAASKLAYCLLSSTGMSIGTTLLGKWELLEEGLQWSNLFVAPPLTNSGSIPHDNFSIGDVCLVLIFDTIVYLLLAWYIEKVRPGSYGLPQPFYFPLLLSYWFPKPAASIDLSSDSGDKEGNARLEYWEPPQEGLCASVKIRALRKVFGKHVALNGISLDMHRGTIVGLLGHNGAGKSTTMSILTGLYPPSAGDVIVNGVSVLKDSIRVRRELGVCLQHNALYDNLTVEEHLKIFACLKALPWRKTGPEVERLLADMDLTSKRGVPSQALSGGMKRKLSIGIALVGGSRVITLDEPTAGVDATSRRAIWGMLAAHKTSRTMLLSTHFMDEADILSDRIAIIAEGQLTAVGGSMGLKRHFAEGYMLTFVVTKAASVAQLSELVLAVIPTAKCEGRRGDELSFSLDFDSRGLFPKLFEKLEKDTIRTALGIQTYGLSVATMEEVFLKASSIHERGLKGQIRDLGADVPSRVALHEPSLSEDNTDQASTHSGTGTPESESSGVLKEQTMSPDNDESIVSVSVICLDEVPRSPQCMSTEPLCVDSNAKVLDGQRSKIVSMSPQENDKNSLDQAEPVIERRGVKGVSMDNHPMATIAGLTLTMQRFCALFIKRALSIRRDKRAWASQLVLPTLFVVLALILAKLLETDPQAPALKLSTQMLLGTNMARSYAVALEKNVVPTASNSSFGKYIQPALEDAEGTFNEFQSIMVDMPGYLMQLSQARQLSNSYGGVDAQRYPAGDNLTLWFNNNAYHIIPVMVNMWNNARVHLCGYEDTYTQAWSHPLPKTKLAIADDLTGSGQAYRDMTVAITVILAMGFVPASFVVHIVHEKASNGKHQQLLTGVSTTMYWLSNYCWDVVNFFVPLIVCTALLATSTAYGGVQVPAIFVLLLAYGACMTAFMYCFDPLFRVPSTAYITLIVVNIFTGTVSVLAVMILDAYQAEIPDLAPLNDFLKVAFPWILPNYCLGRGMINIATNYYINFVAKEFGFCRSRTKGCTISPLDWNVSGSFIFSLFVMIWVWLLMRLLIERGCCLRGLRLWVRSALWKRSSKEEDTREGFQDHDVAKETQRVDDCMNSLRDDISSRDSLIIWRVRKHFMTGALCHRKLFRAVRGVSCGVPAGECFGLLGVNGAGKTTTMGMITGEIEPSTGDVFVGGWSITTNRDRARKQLGYCRQFDALPDKLTARETIALYARIRGVPWKQVKTAVDRMVARMCLDAHQHTLCEHLSGGNRRKLSTALALIGEPAVVLLDEPSTGVDVGARRFLWDIIGSVREEGRAVVLTSHSMEECEVLCTRLTIMAKGQMRCLGTSLQLKDKFGGGYTLTVRTDYGASNSAVEAGELSHTDTLQRFMSSHIPAAALSEENIGLLRFRFAAASTDVSQRDAHGEADENKASLAHVFQTLESAIHPGGALSGIVSDFAISQTSLEEVFLHISREDEAASDLPEAAKLMTGVLDNQVLV